MTNKRKVFIDCGGHNGSSIRFFKDKYDIDDEFEVHSFEPNDEFVHIYEALQEKYENLFCYNVAVSDKDDFVGFYKNVNNSCSNTISSAKGKKKNCGSGVFGEVTETRVECIDLSRWIIENFKKNDYIHLKLDVECEEYRIIEKMIADGSLSYINFLSIEWHTHYCNKSKKDNDRLEKIIKRENIKIDNRWNTMGH